MNPGVDVRLADATPLVLMDVVVLGIALFLLTRVWVMVAPGLGRRLARRALLVGLPLLLVASVIGHAAAPAKVHELSEGVDYTAFFLCFPLGVVWLGALLYRLARRLLGRDKVRGREPTRTTEWLWLGLAMLPVMGLVALIQWQASRDEVKATERRAADLAKIIRALEATEAKAAEFAREREQIGEKVELLHSIVPRSPDLDALVTRLARQAYEYDIQVLEWSGVASEGGDVLQEHQLTVVYGGNLQRLKELVERSEKLARLVVWQRVSLRGDKATAHLIAYSAADRPPAPPRDMCAHPISQVWLWPYTVKLRIARAQVDQRCADLARHAETQAQVDDFQAKKARLVELIEAIEKVRNRRVAPEIVDEKAPRNVEAPIPNQKT